MQKESTGSQRPGVRLHSWHPLRRTEALGTGCLACSHDVRILRWREAPKASSGVVLQELDLSPIARKRTRDQGTLMRAHPFHGQVNHQGMNKGLHACHQGRCQGDTKDTDM